MKIFGLGKLVLVLALWLCLSMTALAQTGPSAADPLIAKLKCPDRVNDVKYSPNGKLLAAGYGWSDHGGATIWNTADNSIAAKLTVGSGDDANVEKVAFSKDDRLFALVNWHGDVHLWKVGSWRTDRIVLTGQDPPKSLDFSPDSTRLVVATENTVVVLDLSTGKHALVEKKAAGSGDYISAGFTVDGKSIVICDGKSMRVVDLETGRSGKSWMTAGTEFFGTVTPNGRYAIAGGGAVFGERDVRIWDTASGNKVGDIPQFRNALYALATSNSNSFFAVAGGGYGNGGDVSIWRLSDLSEIGYVSFGDFPIEGIAFSADDSVLAAASGDGLVLLYDVSRLHGPQTRKQDYELCGEVSRENGRVYIVPLSKVPGPMIKDLEYSWKLEIANSEAVTARNGTPVALQNWDIVSNASGDKVNIKKSVHLSPSGTLFERGVDNIIFGDIQNPGWNEGSLAKLYADGAFVISDNPGKCLAYGSLDRLNTNFAAVRDRLNNSGLADLAKTPLTPGSDHFRSRFIAMTIDGVEQIRSDAEPLETLFNRLPAIKRNAFDRVFSKEEPFINQLLLAGKKGISVPQ